MNNPYPRTSRHANGGLHIAHCPVNSTYMVMWHNTPLSMQPDLSTAIDYLHHLLGRYTAA